jgi:hypothetical protein
MAEFDEIRFVAVKVEEHGDLALVRDGGRPHEFNAFGRYGRVVALEIVRLQNIHIEAGGERVHGDGGAFSHARSLSETVM